MTKTIIKDGYDLGGSEWPNSQYSTVVDLQDPDWSDVEPDHPELFVRQDLRQDFSNLPAKDHINVSLMLRYLNDEDGYLERPLTDQDIKDQQLFAQRIDKVLKPGGQIRIFDHLQCFTGILIELFKLGYTLNDLEMINPADMNMPAEYETILTKTV